MAKDIIRALPEIGRQVVSARVGHQRTRDYPGITPEQMRGIFTQATQGTRTSLEAYADLCEYIAEDPLVASCLDTLIHSISAATFDVVPGKGDPVLAERAADFTRNMFDDMDDIEQVKENLLLARWSGYSLGEIEWVREPGVWVPKVSAIMMRDVALAPDWSFIARSFAESAAGDWLSCSEHPGKFVGFQYRSRGSSPLKSGLVRRVAWYWLFRKMVTVQWNSGAERLANPLAIGKVGREASAEARENLKAGLENLSDGQVAMLEEETGIEFPDTKFSTSSAVWKDLADDLKQNIILAILGSMDAVDGGSNGSLARAQTQAEQTIEPRQLQLSKQLYGVLERDLVTPFLSFNSGLFGGVMPPVPRLKMRETKSLDVTLLPLLVQTGSITTDELRAAANLEPLQKETADVSISETAQSAGGADAEVPLARANRQATLNSSQTSKSSATSSASLTNAIATALGLSSVDRVSSWHPRPSTPQLSLDGYGATSSQPSAPRRARKKRAAT